MQALTKEDVQDLPDELLRELGILTIQRLLGSEVVDRVFGTFEERKQKSKKPVKNNARTGHKNKLKKELVYAEAKVRNLKRRIAEYESI